MHAHKWVFIYTFNLQNRISVSKVELFLLYHTNILDCYFQNLNFCSSCVNLDNSLEMIYFSIVIFICQNIVAVFCLSSLFCFPSVFSSFIFLLSILLGTIFSMSRQYRILAEMMNWRSTDPRIWYATCPLWRNQFNTKNILNARSDKSFDIFCESTIMKLLVWN